MVCISASNGSPATIWTSLGIDIRRRLLQGAPKCCRWPSMKKKLVRRLTTLGSNSATTKPFPSFAVHNVDEEEIESYRLQAPSYLPVGRRLMMGFMSVFCAQNYVPVARASVSKRVMLKDVENPKLQDALRAAVAGDLENSEKIFSELIADDPENASVWSNRGSVRLSMNKFDEATQDLSEAIKLAPEAPVPFLNRAIAYEALGRYTDAIEDCKSAIVNDPEEFAAWYNLGNVDLRVKDYDGALVAYEKASALAPGIAGYRLKQALVLFQLRRPEEARKIVEGLVRKYPNYAEAHAALAAILWSENRRSGAEDQFTEATIREPLYREIGWVNAELQWPPSIIQAMENFLSIK
eukprot:Gb_05022 [translate_table: standard]